MVINIKNAEKGTTKAIIGIAGVSGSGKTYTALKIARGMVSSASKIGLLDTENGRGAMYADILDNKFLIGGLIPPFSPTRYVESIKQFQQAGVEVLIIDSISHEWEGDGGCEDIANQPLKQNKKMADWITAKREHKAFMNALLHCSMHIICCIRAREKMDFANPTKPVSLGIQPICEKNFLFEMTASIMIENEGRELRHLKMPQFLKEAFRPMGGYLDEMTGERIVSVLGSGDTELAKIKSDMLIASNSGVNGVVKIWNKLSLSQKKQLEAHKNMCKEAAEAFEKSEKESNFKKEITNPQKIDLP